ncbi:MAG TPA: discoidin domain-containing protein [Trebonia sp.]|nr:discoidin domain-containing protein [Trebonia sp.]
MTIGTYRLQARLGAGGMGRVYLAFTPAGRPVALKVVRSGIGDDLDFLVRFRQEIQAAQRVRGLYTAELIDADPTATPPWLVTAYVPGPSLEEVIDNDGPMPEAMVFRLIAGVAEALQAIHAAGVIHRDLKPSNVLLAADGPRVIDFGIARALATMPLTRNDVMMGSPDFLSPEQILRQPITPAIDVFALGSLAAFAALGRLPFGQGHITEVAHRVAHEPPSLAGCPVRLLTLIESCLEKQPEARPGPARIIEFCVARAAELTDSGRPWPTWGGSGGGPGRGQGSAQSATAVLPDPAQLVSAGKPRRRSLALGVGLAAAVLAAAVISIAVAGHLATDNAPAGRPDAASHPTAGAAAPARSPAVRQPVRPVSLLSQGRPVTASSIQGPPWPAADAVDGTVTTRWSSGWSDPQWLEVDLGTTHAITKVALDWEHAYATAFQIQVSDDGATWTDVYSTTTGAGGAQTIQVNAAGRYVRMYGTTRATQYGYSLWEFQVFGR